MTLREKITDEIRASLRWYEKPAALLVLRWWRREHVELLKRLIGLTGLKTYLGGWLVIAYGLHLIINENNVDVGIKYVGEGLTIVGIGAKIERLIKSRTKENTPTLVDIAKGETP